MTLSVPHHLPPRPAHGFPPEEFTLRVDKLQALMAPAELDALLLTTSYNIRYVTGFDSQFWESPTRPWFVAVPADGHPVAVIPEIAGPQMAATWLDDVRTWQAPCPADDGISLLAGTLREFPRKHGRIGAELGREMPMRLPWIEFRALTDAMADCDFVDGSSTIWKARQVKTEAEIERIRYAARIASVAYEQLPGYAGIGMSEREINNRLSREMLGLGADAVPFLPVISGPGGVGQIVVGPGDRVLADGDILFIDTGITYDGYFCDFDRCYAVGNIDDDARRAHDIVWRATEAAIDAVRPGMTSEALWAVQNKILSEAGALPNNVGRLGHGLGLQLTEPPSHMPGDTTILEENMVLTIEPGVEYAPGRMIVHEENIVLRAEGAELLSTRAPRDMWRIA